jgi:hypothetical protein
MNKNIVTALILIALVVVVLIMTKGTTSVNLVVMKVSASTSFMLLGFTGIGTLIGLLLK